MRKGRRKVAICKADGSGYLRILKMALMPNVVCHWNSWLKLKVERRGNRIQVWVGGVKGPCVTDDTYGPGRPGLTGFAKYIVRDLKIDGEPVAGPDWQEGDRRGKPWFLPVPDTNIGDLQDPGPLCKLSDDEIVMAFPVSRKESDYHDSLDNACVHLLSSRDGGRTWSPYGVVKDRIPGRWFVAGPVPIPIENNR